MRLALGLCLIAMTACVHHNRVSRRDIQRLTTNHEKFVLVFGSISTPSGTLEHPAIQFLHQASMSDPRYVLRSMTITSGDRFYAVLRRPEGLASLDEFIVEVGTPEIGFDRITYVRLQEGAAPLAMYVGEMRMNPADSRTAQGQKVFVTTVDDFHNATQELKRLYPEFKGNIEKVALLRNLSPPTTPLERVR
jgi:hypothetical protein